MKKLLPRAPTVCIITMVPAKERFISLIKAADSRLYTKFEIHPKKAIILIALMVPLIFLVCLIISHIKVG